MVNGHRVEVVEEVAGDAELLREPQLVGDSWRQLRAKAHQDEFTLDRVRRDAPLVHVVASVALDEALEGDRLLDICGIHDQEASLASVTVADPRGTDARMWAFGPRQRSSGTRAGTGRSFAGMMSQASPTAAVNPRSPSIMTGMERWKSMPSVPDRSGSSIRRGRSR